MKPKVHRQFADFQSHFQQADPIVFDLMQQVGPFGLALERNRFWALVRSIISQQLSTAAARTIRLRLEALLAPEPLTPATLGKLEKPQLRSVGLSNQKADYLLDLVDKVQGGTVQLSVLGRKKDEEIIRELTQVRGIGRWTAQMFLIFSLGRLDVFPHDDLGVRVALRDLYGLADLPDPKTSQRIAEVWKPYSSVASWYCWRKLDLGRSAKPQDVAGK